MQETVAINLVEVPIFKALAVSTGLTPDKSGTREAWSKLTAQLPIDDERLTESTSAYVFIPQELMNVDTLWVGLAVREFSHVPDGIETLEVSGGLCVSAQVYGNAAHMWEVYDAINAWLEQSADYEMDRSVGSLGMETVPFVPLNALAIPYSEIEIFNFTLFYPVCKKVVLKLNKNLLCYLQRSIESKKIHVGNVAHMDF